MNMKKITIILTLYLMASSSFADIQYQLSCEGKGEHQATTFQGHVDLLGAPIGGSAMDPETEISYEQMLQGIITETKIKPGPDNEIQKQTWTLFGSIEGEGLTALYAKNGDGEALKLLVEGMHTNALLNERGFRNTQSYVVDNEIQTAAPGLIEARWEGRCTLGSEENSSNKWQEEPILGEETFLRPSAI